MAFGRRRPAHSKQSESAIKKQGMRAAIALDQIKQYCRAGHRQCHEMHDRFAIAHSLLRDGRNEEANREIDSAYAALHFYAICWNSAERYLNVLRLSTGLDEVKALQQTYKATLADYGVLRDHLEHLDERLPGRKSDALFSTDQDGALTWGIRGGGDWVEIGTQRWDISEASGTRLLQLDRELVDALKSHFGFTSGPR